MLLVAWGTLRPMATKTSRSLGALLAAMALAAGPAFALSVATEPQLLCAGSHVVDATVDTAEIAPVDCLFEPYKASACACKGTLTLRISKVLAVKPEVASYPEDVGIAPGAAVSTLWQRPVYPPEADGAAFCAKLRDDLMANHQLVSIGTFFAHWSDGTTHVSRPPYGAHYWTIDRQDWAMSLMKDSRTTQCARPLP